MRGRSASTSTRRDPGSPRRRARSSAASWATGRGSIPDKSSGPDLEALQAWTDEQVIASAKRRTCPVTGGSVFEAWQAEKEFLGPIPLHWPEPFDLVQQRRVATDATIRFEGRTYSVPFRFVGQTVEVHGCARTVQVVGDGSVVAEHPRRTRSRLLVDPRHYEGPGTDEVEAPIPLGRMGKRLQEIYDLAPEQRPLDLYAALAEVAR